MLRKSIIYFELKPHRIRPEGKNREEQAEGRKAVC